MTRIGSSVTSLSWIPLGAMEGVEELAVDLGLAHWDLPPPDRLESLHGLVRRRRFLQLTAPTAWTTLALTIHADGSSEHQVVGASPFPRHWIYDHTGVLVAKTGLIDFTGWLRGAFGRHTPWGEEESPALV